MRGPLLAIALSGCGFVPSGLDWTDQLEPSGPCYDANLLDGLATDTTAEAHAVFACLNAEGALEGFVGLDAALDAPTRDGAVGIVLAVWLAEAAAEAESAALGDLVGAARGLLDDPSVITETLPLLWELSWGTPWAWFSADTPAQTMSAGLLLPGLELVGSVAPTLIGDEAWVAPMAAAARSERTRALLWTFAALPTATDSTLRSLGEDWAVLLSDAWRYAQDTGNDRGGGSGNSVRDLLVALAASEGEGLAVDVVLSAASPMLVDPAVGQRFAAMLTEQAAYGRLSALPGQLAWLASVDAEGGALDGGEDSALAALVRLLARGDQSVDCSVDLGLFDVDFSLGNLSESLLELLAEQDPDTVASGVDLLGDLLGVSLTDTVLDAVADSGVCPAIDAQMVDDLHALDRLSDPQADDLLRVMLAVLDASEGHIGTLVSALHAGWDAELVPPLEAVVRDLGDTPLASTLVESLAVLVQTSAHTDDADFPADVAPVDFALLWELLGEWSVAGSSALAGPVVVAVEAEPLWTLLHNAMALLGNPEAQVPTLLPELSPLLWEDPALSWREDVALGLEDPTLRRRVLVLAETDALRDAIGQESSGPVPTLAGWTYNGSLTVLIDTLTALDALIPESS